MAGTAVTFYGVRGSTPFAAAAHTEFGGNTCCVVVGVDDEAPIILDMGSGMFGYSMALGGQPLTATVLLTHLHWDHVAGLPFFGPALCPGGTIEIWGPPDEGMTLRQAFDRLVAPPFFPVTLNDFAGTITIRDLWCDDLAVGSAKVAARPVPHTSATSGYRIDTPAASIAYVPDHQQPLDDPSVVAESVLELCAGVDLLIHDGQYPPHLFEQRAHWGHSTPAYAIEVARQAGAKALALFSHDPMHDDDELGAIEREARATGMQLGIDVFSAREGRRIDFA